MTAWRVEQLHDGWFAATRSLVHWDGFGPFLGRHEAERCLLSLGLPDPNPFPRFHLFRKETQ